LFILSQDNKFMTSMENIPSVIESSLSHLALGFRHILPDGLDHVLFVLGLFLMCRDWVPLLWQVTLFTLAHSLTLGLAMCGVVSVPAGPVELLIALSIVGIGLENVFSHQSQWLRPMMIVCFGLVHGFGFAQAFSSQGLGTQDLALALVSLNLGVELGQIAVIALAGLLFSGFWQREWYRRMVTVPGSLLIAGAGLVWVFGHFL
jgi:hypothetical protein